MDMVRCHCWFGGYSNALGGIPVVTYVLMLALAVSGQQKGGYEGGAVIYSGDNQPVNVGYRIDFSGWDGDDASLLAAWIEQQHQEWLATNRGWAPSGWHDAPVVDEEGWTVTKLHERPIHSDAFNSTRYMCDESGCTGQQGKRPKPTNQPVRLIDGRRAYLSCPDDKRQDCTLSVSKPKPSGHAVSTHTKAGK
jgi:hypothetical protein